MPIASKTGTHLHRNQGILLSGRAFLLCFESVPIGILRMEQWEDVPSSETE